jgi:hypothetical protein
MADAGVKRRAFFQEFLGGLLVVPQRGVFGLRV